MSEIDATIKFTFDEFNPRRAMRGVEAARIYVDYLDGQGEDWLWMGVSDLNKNIKEFGPHPALVMALEHYKTRKPFNREKPKTEATNEK